MYKESPNTNFWVHHWFQLEFGWSKIHYHVRGLNSLGFGAHLQGENGEGKPALPHYCTQLSWVSQDTSTSHWLKFSHPKHQQNTSCPGDAPWTEWAWHACRETRQVKILSRDFAREMLCSNILVVIIKTGKGMSLLLTSQLGTVLSQTCQTHC